MSIGNCKFKKLRFHYIPIRMANIQNTGGKDVVYKELSLIVGENIKLFSH